MRKEIPAAPGSRQLSRRTVLRGGGLLALGATAPSAFLRLAARPPTSATLGWATPGRATLGQAGAFDHVLTRSRFAPLIGQRFVLRSSSEQTEAVLTRIDDLLPLDPSKAENRFSLLFTAKAGRPIGDVRSIGHEQLGKIPLFASPVGPLSTVLHYEAVIYHS